MQIVDAQVHIWGADSPQRPWRVGPRNAPHRPLPFSKDDLLQEMSTAGVARVILVPPSMEGDRNDLVLEAARLHPDRFAAMGRFDVAAAPRPEAIANWRRQPGMLGLRLTFDMACFRPMLAEGRLEWLWSAAERHGVPIMVMVGYDQAPLIDRIAEAHPQLKLILDHLCLLTKEKDEHAFAGIERMLALARRANVAVKASALQCYTADRFPFRGLHPYLRRVFDAFGPTRMFWGTDLTRLPCSYREAIAMFTQELPWLDSRDLEWVMGRGVCEWTGWPWSSPHPNG